MLVLCVQEWAAQGPESMLTNNLSLTLRPGKEEEVEEETASARTKCPAQGRDCQRWAIEGTERWRGEETEGDQHPEENPVSSPSLRSITLHISSNKQRQTFTPINRHYARTANPWKYETWDRSDVLQTNYAPVAAANSDYSDVQFPQRNCITNVPCHGLN